GGDDEGRGNRRLSPHGLNADHVGGNQDRDCHGERKSDDSAASDGNEQQADGATYHRIDDTGAEDQNGLFHHRVTGCDHRTDGPNWIGLAELVDYNPEHRGGDEDTHGIVDTVHVALDETIEFPVQSSQWPHTIYPARDSSALFFAAGSLLFQRHPIGCPGSVRRMSALSGSP